jgi:hypothetical protein
VQEDVFARLGHDAVGCGDDEDRAVHLGGTRDHVLDVVGVTRSVDVCVVTIRRLVLGVRERNGNTARLLFRRLVDIIDALVWARVAVAGLESTFRIAAVSVVLPWST